MKRAKILLAGLLLAVPLLLGVGVAGAQNFRSGDSVTVAEDETVDTTLFASGRALDIAGEVQGDIFCVGQNITISGTVRGDVICAGQNITVTGNVEGDVRAAGQTVVIGGEVGSNVSFAGQSLTLESDASVDGDVSLAGDSMTLNGQVGRDVFAAAATLSANGDIGRDITASLTNLNVGSNASVGGEVIYTSVNDANIASGAQITGDATKQDPPRREGKDGAFFAISSGFALYLLVSLLLIALILVLIFPRPIHEASETGLRHPARTLLIGFVASLLVPMLVLGLLITVVGIPLALLLLFTWFVVLFLAGPLSGYFIGRLILRDSRSPIIIMLVGAALLLIVYIIPILGFLALLAAMWMGVGLLLTQVWSRTPRPDYSLEESARG